MARRKRAGRGQGDLFEPLTKESDAWLKDLHLNENLEALRDMEDESVDLIYLDPPFFSNHNYEVIWGEEAEIRSFKDRWEGGINVYINWMKERVLELRRVLKPNGTIYLHCDWHAGHYLKVMMDDVFGYKNFLNEIVWHYESAGGAPKKTLHRNHDTIFRYAATDKRLVTWNAPRKPWPETTLKKWQTDEKGIYHVHSDTGRRYYVHPEGKLDDDVWDITFPARSKERIGWPTQKPEELLEKIVKASSNETDIVLDPFCGCGTSVAVADRLNRQFIGIDISPKAISVMERRLLKQHCRPRIWNAIQSVADLKKLHDLEFENWVIDAISGRPASKAENKQGIDGFWYLTHHPVQVKHFEHVGRPWVDKFETAMRRGGYNKGYIVGFSFTGDAHEEAARAKKDGLEIVLVKAEQILLLVRRPHGKLGPIPGSVEELPFPEVRRRKDMPSVREILKSEEQNGDEAIGE